METLRHRVLGEAVNSHGYGYGWGGGFGGGDVGDFPLIFALDLSDQGDE